MPDSAVVLRRAFAAAAVLWASALPITSFAASRPAPGAGWYAVALVAYGAGSLVCHQQPERSFHLWAAQMPVCARCAGIYFGGAIAAIAAVLAGDRQRRQARSPPREMYATHWLVAAAAPTAATLVFEWTTGVTPSNAMRALAGMPLGAAVAVVIVGATRRAHRDDERVRRALASEPDLME